MNTENVPWYVGRDEVVVGLVGVGCNVRGRKRGDAKT